MTRYNHENQGTGYDPGAAGHELQGRASQRERSAPAPDLDALVRAMRDELVRQDREDTAYRAENPWVEATGAESFDLEKVARAGLAAIKEPSDLSTALRHLRTLFPETSPSSRWTDDELWPHAKRLTCGQIREIAAFLDQHK